MLSTSVLLMLPSVFLLSGCGRSFLGTSRGNGHLPPREIRHAIDAGVRYLATTQLPNGAFPIYGSQDPEELDGGRLTISPLFTTWVVWALREVDHSLLQPMINRALIYLHNEMEPHGLWRFYGHADSWHLASGPDLEDIAVASAILTLHHMPFPDNVGELLPYRTPEGAFLTWQDAHSLAPNIRTFVDELKTARHIPLHEANDVDCALNANVLFYLALRDRQDAQACTFVNTCVAAHDVPRCSLYYVSATPICYMVVRAYDAGATCLAPSLKTIRAWLPRLQRQDGSWGNDLETACAITALLRLGVHAGSIDRAVTQLLAHQQSDGSWPRCRFVEANHRSEAVTTGFVIEALTAYLASRGEATR